MGRELALRRPCGLGSPESPSAPRLRLVCDLGLERRAAALLHDFRAHEQPETFRRLFEATGPALLPLVRMKIRRLRCSVDPGELLTDTFAQVYRFRHTFRDRGPGSFVRWFLAIADNLVKQDARSTTRRQRREQLAARSIEDHASDPVQNLLGEESQRLARITYGELRHSLLAAVNRLPPGQEQVLMLHAQEQLTYAQIGARLGISVGAVAMRLKRARARLMRDFSPGRPSPRPARERP